MPKFGIFVHPKRPKIPVDKILRRLRSAGASHSQENPDLAIVVGGDGTFAYYGRTLSMPLLFVGVKETGIIGSRAKLAEILYEDLDRAIQDIESGRYSVLERKMLSVRLNEHSEDVLTDVYVERGRFAGCLRYRVSARPLLGHEFVPFNDYAIGNGVVVSTSFGSGGYYSYPDRLGSGKKARKSPADFSDDRIGICHIIPAYLVRRDGPSPNIRYTLPPAVIKISLMRDARARLYGTTLHSKGVSVRMGDTITVSPAKRHGNIIKLRS